MGGGGGERGGGGWGGERGGGGGGGQGGMGGKENTAEFLTAGKAIA